MKSPTPARATQESPAETLRRCGLKLTRPRLLILERLQAHAQLAEHATIEQLVIELSGAKPAIGIGTIYRVLAQLEAHGITRRHHFAHLPTAFELCVEAEHHHHIVDQHAGIVRDFRDPFIEQRLRELASMQGYQYLGSALTMYVQTGELR